MKGRCFDCNWSNNAEITPILTACRSFQIYPAYTNHLLDINQHWDMPIAVLEPKICTSSTLNPSKQRNS